MGRLLPVVALNVTLFLLAAILATSSGGASDGDGGLEDGVVLTEEGVAPGEEVADPEEDRRDRGGGNLNEEVLTEVGEEHPQEEKAAEDADSDGQAAGDGDAYDGGIGDDLEDDGQYIEQLRVDAANQRNALDMEADYQEMDGNRGGAGAGGGGGGGHCLRTTEDPMGETICEEWSDQEEDPVTKYQASQDGGVGTFPILMAVVTAGLIFFVLGFLLNRYRSSSGSKHDGSTPETVSMKPVYAATPTQPPDEDKDEKSAPTKSTTPEIIYTNHDEPDVQGAPPDVILQPPPSANKRQQQVKKPMPPIGKYQSPINIDPDDAELSDDLENSHLVFKYVPENTKSLTNLGSTVKVMVDCRGSDLHGGPLGDDRRYCLDHFRFRWGADDTRGSEHSVAGKRYAGEIQLVHWNKEDFRTYSEASRYESGLAIISVFINVSEEQHTSLQTLLDVFKSIKYKGDSVEVPHHYFDPASLLPGNTMDYWTYSGSLTESPYPETVTWLVMKEPISVSSSQMVQLRGLMRCERDEAHGMPGEEQLVDNFRKQSALGDRRLRASFH